MVESLRFGWIRFRVLANVRFAFASLLQVELFSNPLQESKTLNGPEKGQPNPPLGRTNGLGCDNMTLLCIELAEGLEVVGRQSAEHRRS